ncbi:MarR family winged helix-turn-helix transcriptional regulator [Nocardia asteroides]
MGDSEARDDYSAAEGGPALFRLVRFWSRRWSNQTLAETGVEPGDGRRVQHIQVVEAVGAVARTGVEPAVSDVADQLGLDHSGASRMVRDAVAAGLVVRVGSAQDRRRVVVRLTDGGTALLAASREWQQRQFDELTAAWSDPDRRRFAGYLRRLADEAVR